MGERWRKIKSEREGGGEGGRERVRGQIDNMIKTWRSSFLLFDFQVNIQGAERLKK